MSITVCWNACPICSVPVTFGGGSRMLYGSPWPLGLIAPLASQRSYHFDSIRAGSKLFSIGKRSLARRGALLLWGKAEIVRCRQGPAKDGGAALGRDVSCGRCPHGRTRAGGQCPPYSRGEPFADDGQRRAGTARRPCLSRPRPARRQDPAAARRSACGRETAR